MELSKYYHYCFIRKPFRRSEDDVGDDSGAIKSKGEAGKAAGKKYMFGQKIKEKALSI